MSPHQNYGQPTYEFHPEFAICPSISFDKTCAWGSLRLLSVSSRALAGAVALLPRHGASAALTTPVLAVAPAGPTSDLAPLPHQAHR